MSGIKREFLASQNFVMIHLSLVDHGMSWEAAAVLHRIDYRSGGGGWWTVTKADMQTDMRISERKLDRALAELRELGLLRSERASAETSLMRWGVQYVEHPAGQNVPQPSGTKRPDAEDETSSSSYKNVENKDSSSSDADGGSKPPTEEPAKEPLSTEDELFEDFWAHYPKKVSKKDAAVAFGKALKKTDYLTIRAGLVAAIKAWRTDEKVTVEKVGDEVKVKVAAGEPGKGVPHAATWLNGERWNDEHPEAKTAAGPNGEDANSWMHRTRDNTV